MTNPVPSDPLAEAGAIGCVLLASNGESRDMLDKLEESDFQDVRHVEIFRALLELQFDNSHPNIVSLTQRLKDSGHLDRAGGFDYLQTLPDATPSAHNFPTYLDTIKDRSTRRSMLLEAHSLQQRAEDLSTPVEPRSKLLTFTDATDFMAAPIARPLQLVDGIVHAGEKLAIGGGSKSFKTWALLDLAISVAHASPWLSFPCRCARVLFVNFELQEWALQRRFQAVADAKTIKLEPSRLSILSLRGKESAFGTLVPQIERSANRDFGLIILDPVYKLYGNTDENKAGDVAKLLNALECMAVSTGATIAFGHHFSKGNQAGKESIDRFSGSGVFARDPDSLLVMTQQKTDDCFSVQCTLRNFPPVQPFVVRWTYPVFTPDLDLDPEDLKKPGGRKKQFNSDMLLDLLGTKNLTTTEWLTTARTEIGLKDRLFYELKSELHELNRIFQSKVTSKWQRT